MKSDFFFFAKAAGVVPWVFSQEDLVIQPKKKKHKTFITGLSGSGKTTMAKNNKSIFSADDLLDNSRSIQSQFGPFRNKVKEISKKRRIEGIEGTQLAYMRPDFPKDKWVVKRTSVLRSLVNSISRDFDEGGVAGLAIGLKKIKERLSKNIKHKRQIDRDFSKAAAISDSYRDSLSGGQFAIPEERKFPIQSRKQARTAIAFANWPNNAKYKKSVLAAVRNRYPDLIGGK